MGGLGPEYSPPWPDTDERRVLDGSSNWKRLRAGNDGRDGDAGGCQVMV
jgi:hypothetical protein